MGRPLLEFASDAGELCSPEFIAGGMGPFEGPIFASDAGELCSPESIAGGMGPFEGPISKSVHLLDELLEQAFHHEVAAGAVVAARAVATLDLVELGARLGDGPAAGLELAGDLALV